MYRIVCFVARWRICGVFETANLHKKNDIVGDALFFFSVKMLLRHDLCAAVAS
jgi:hypothetical protein